ncbi:MAG TPA: hypothetical protein PLH11_07915 [Gemmobacter sp.]|nr:hypothetical protein [Gemmobacter sp.]
MTDTRWVTYSGVTLLSLVIFGLPAWSTSAVFTFPAQTGHGTMTYRCPQRETPAQTEANARAAHAAFEAALKTAAQDGAKAMARLMASDRPSAEIAARLEALNTEAEATRNLLHDQMQNQFGCQYRGSS